MRTGLTWCKSSYSGSEGGACVEVALDERGELPVLRIRDSKNPAGPALTVAPASWAAFARDLPARR
ncbi:DUF397 domain-containing protein [Streptomyces fuscigenes]|uniref:DUF397 domain-containing protein n=1 Tax=Streptomyces fuscigenes TaxID=1528880 RepID=UPI001F29584A|nr:DUF397 domain-containing protein [Streptomyces fuscigenes]MCF3962887.1 DUF397 domain-containing protein [Streptomyces fuscigenes]